MGKNYYGPAGIFSTDNPISDQMQIDEESWVDPLEEAAFHGALAENGLRLRHYERGRALWLGGMRYCIGVAHRTSAGPTL